MSEASRTSSLTVNRNQILQARTEENFYAPLVTLYALWCFKLFNTNKDRRPAMTSLAYVDNAIILGCSIPEIPHLLEAKEFLRNVREEDMKAQHRMVTVDNRADSSHRVTVEGHELVRQGIGHCAETCMFQFLWSLYVAMNLFRTLQNANCNIGHKAILKEFLESLSRFQRMILDFSPNTITRV
jgi:hypothetical protein